MDFLDAIPVSNEVDEAYNLALTPEGCLQVAREHGILEGSDESALDFEKCTQTECLICGIIACPSREPLHLHHDGCPTCER